MLSFPPYQRSLKTNLKKKEKEGKEILTSGKTVSDAKKRHGRNLASSARTARICGEKKKKIEGMYNAVRHCRGGELTIDRVTIAGGGKKNGNFAPFFAFFFEKAADRSLDHECSGMYKQCSLSFFFLFPLSLFSFVSLCQTSQLKPKFKAYVINRHSVFVWLCVCVPVLGMIRRERVRESCTMTEGLVSGIPCGSAVRDLPPFR